MALLAYGVKFRLIVQHLLRRVRDLLQLSHERALRNISVPLVAQLPPPRALATYALGATLVRRTTVFAVELTQRGLTVRASKKLVAHAADVVEGVHAVAVPGAPVRAVNAERLLAVWPTVSPPAAALTVLA